MAWWFGHKKCGKKPHTPRTTREEVVLRMDEVVDRLRIQTAALYMYASEAEREVSSAKEKNGRGSPVHSTEHHV